MARGPAPTPSAILRLRGTDRPDRVSRDEPRPELAASAAAPAGLRGRARQLWNAHAPELHRLGLLTVLDLESFSTWCRTVAAQDRVERRLRSLDVLERRQQRVHRQLLAASAKAAAQDLDAAYRAIQASLEQQRQWSTERQRLTRELRIHFEMARTLAARFGFTPSDRRALSSRMASAPPAGTGGNPHDELARRRAARAAAAPDTD